MCRRIEGFMQRINDWAELSFRIDSWCFENIVEVCVVVCFTADRQSWCNTWAQITIMVVTVGWPPHTTRLYLHKHPPLALSCIIDWWGCACGTSIQRPPKTLLKHKQSQNFCEARNTYWTTRPSWRCFREPGLRRFQCSILWWARSLHVALCDAFLSWARLNDTT